MQQVASHLLNPLESRTMAPTTVEDMAQARGRKEAVLCLKFGNGIDQLKVLTRALREIDTPAWAVTSIHLKVDAQNWDSYPLELSEFFCAIGDLDSVSRLQIEATQPFTACPLQLVTALLRKMRFRLEALQLHLNNFFVRTADLRELEEAIEEMSCLSRLSLTVEASSFLEDDCYSTDSSLPRRDTDAAWTKVVEVWDEHSAQGMEFTCDLFGAVTDVELLPKPIVLLSFTNSNCGSFIGPDCWPLVRERVSPFGSFPANFAISSL